MQRKYKIIASGTFIILLMTIFQSFSLVYAFDGINSTEKIIETSYTKEWIQNPFFNTQAGFQV